MLPKDHLTSHSRMSGSRWVNTPSWLSGSLRPFLYRSYVYSFHLFLISSASVRSVPFLSLIVPNFAWNVPLLSLIFWKRSQVFSILLFSFFFFSFFFFFSCVAHLRSLVYLSFLFSGMPHSIGYIFPFLLCLLLLFSAIFKGLLRQLICFLAFLYFWDGFGHCILYNVINFHS